MYIFISILWYTLIILILYLLKIIYEYYVLSKIRENIIDIETNNHIKYNNNITNSTINKPMENMIYLFCYGSNSVKQIKERLNIERKLEYYPAYIKNYARIFAGKSKKWENGGIASIIPLRYSIVYGICVKITEEELLQMDTHEGGYYRIIVDGKIQSKKNRSESFYVYLKNNIDFSVLPSEKYLVSIHNMLNDRTIFNINNNINTNTNNITADNINKKIIIRGLVDKKLVKIGYWNIISGFKLYKKVKKFD